MTAHALLGASSAHRWLACTPSARLEESAGGPDKGSPYAEEGTAAHAYAETELSLRLGLISKRSWAGRMKAHKAGPWWGAEMEEAIDSYATEVAGIVEGMREDDFPEPFVDLERRVDYSEYVPGGFGTADVVVIGKDVLHVIDLKYGKGVPVSAEGNPQLRLYALGAALHYAPLFGFDVVRMTIVQPRLGSSSTDTVSFASLIDWAEGTVEPAARAADEGRGEFAPGEAACRFCRAKAVCRARADEALAVAQEEFETPAELLSASEVAELLPLLPRVEAWAKDVQAWALVQARDHGVRFAGYKLVEGRSNRRITDGGAAMLALEDAGYGDDQYLKPGELQTITALEKLLGKKTFADLLGGYVDKPTGKPVLVAEGDRRPEISSAEGALADFEEVG